MNAGYKKGLDFLNPNFKSRFNYIFIYIDQPNVSGRRITYFYYKENKNMENEWHLVTLTILN